MHADYAIFYQLSIVMGIAAGLSLIAKLFRQPLIIAYIASGILVGPTFLNVIHDQSAFESFSQIGIALLLFIIGLGLNVSIIRNTGKPVIVTFGAITLGLGSLSYIVSQLFGFSHSEGVVMAIAMLFSSTIIIVKSLSDKKEQSRLYGQIAIGILLAEDVVATLALLYISASAGNGSSGDVLTLLGKGIFLGSVLTLVGGFIMPKLSKVFASSQELLYIFALAWVFGIASLFAKAGFSIEIGALFAGVALAHLPYAPAISARLKLLRDFFIVLFFIRLGEQLGINDLNAALVPAAVFSIIAVVTKPVLTMLSLGVLGYTKQTSFKTAVHLSQISEFSIILVVLVQTTGTITRDLTTIIALTAIFTIAISTYLMKYDDELYRLLERPLAFFERSKTKQEMRSLSHYPLVMLGYHEGGYTFVRTFRRIKKRYIVIDYNPDVIDTLEHQHVNHLYGDATDLELLEEIGVRKSELIISNISDSGTNQMLAKHITSSNDKAIFICRAARLNDAEALYEAGAAYVMMPHFIGDEHINSFIQRNGSNKHAFSKYRQQHLMQLAGVSMRLK
jgi:Kef-type K+ transport system membrane component KefB